MVFSMGEIVQLKSGGPAMTIVKVEDSNIHCIWFSETNEEVRTAVIASVALEAKAADKEEEEKDGADKEGGMGQDRSGMKGKGGGCGMKGRGRGGGMRK